GLDDPRLLPRDLLDRVAEDLGVIQADRGDDRHQRREDVGAIEPAAEADLDHGDVDLAFGEVEESERRRHLEEGAVAAFGESFDPVERLLEPALVGPLADDADALTEVDQMRRGVEAGAHTRLAQRALDERAHRALAVGARDVHGAEARVGIPQRAEQRAGAVESELVLAAFEAIERLEPALKPGGHLAPLPAPGLPSARGSSGR